MTKEEAINVLNDYDINFEGHTAEEIAEAHEMAIKVLGQQPCEDCVSREAVLSIIKRICFSEEYLQFRVDHGSNGQRDTVIIRIKALPSVSPQPSERTEERTETHECDCISRKAVLDALHRYFADGFDSDKWWNSTYVLDAVNKVPSATSQLKTGQPKTGHWEWVQYDANPNIGNWHCSECSCNLRGETNKGPVRLPKYCPECGAKMQE
jgi:hypothetical protein